MKRIKRSRVFGSLAMLSLVAAGCASAHDGQPSQEKTGVGEGAWDTESDTDTGLSTHMWLVERALQLLSSNINSGDATRDSKELAIVQTLLSRGANGVATPCGVAWRRGINDADFLAIYNNGSSDSKPGSNYLELFESGANWKSHFFDPTTARNYKGELTPTAYGQTVDLYAGSVGDVVTSENIPETACYKLGVALHYLTDLSQPMHAANFTTLSAPRFFHSHYESWAMSTVQPKVTGLPSWQGPGQKTVGDIAKELAFGSYLRWNTLKAQHEAMIDAAGILSPCYGQHIDATLGVLDAPSCWNTSADMEKTTREAFDAGTQYAAMLLQRWVEDVVGAGGCVANGSVLSPRTGLVGAPSSACMNDAVVTSCRDVRDLSPKSGDGEYDIRVGLDTLRVYCYDMAGAPREYLTLPHSQATGEDVNYASYGTDVNGSPGVKTSYTKLRFLLDDRSIDVTDRTFARSTGSFFDNYSTTTAVDYAAAGDCGGNGSLTGRANINLVGLPSQVITDQLVTHGWVPNGSETYASANQVVNVSAGGYCGYRSTPSGRLALSWSPPALAGHSQVALAGLAAVDGVVRQPVGGSGSVYWDIVPVSADDPYQGYRLAMGGQYISSTTKPIPSVNDALATVGSVDAAAAFVPMWAGDGRFVLRLAGSSNVLTLDARGSVGLIEPRQADNGATYIQYFATDLRDNVLPHPADLEGWTVLENGGQGWSVTPPSHDWPGVLGTSYGWDTRQRVVDLSAIGYSPDAMDASPRPALEVSERFNKTYCGGKFRFTVELLDANQAVVGTWDGSGDAPTTHCAWDDEHVDQTHRFTDYPAGVRYVRWTDGGVDTLYWAGFYGPSLSRAALYMKAPAPTPPASAQ